MCLLAETFLESFEANGSRRWMAGLTWNRTVLGLDLCLPVLCIRVHTRSPEMPGGTTVLHPVWKDELVAHFTMPITEDLSGNPWRMLSVTPPPQGSERQREKLDFVAGRTAVENQPGRPSKASGGASGSSPRAALFTSGGNEQSENNAARQMDHAE